MKEDHAWKSLLIQSAPTFAGETAPPYGFMTATLAQVRAQTRQKEQMERIGLRALWVSLAALVIVTGVTLGREWQDHRDAESSVRGIIQFADIAVS